MDKEKAAAAFPKLFEDIREVIYQHDPSGLFAMGAPKDEHDDSIHRIISLLQHIHGPEGVQEVLEDAMRDWIADKGDNPKEVCTAMAPAVWTAWSEFRGKVG